MHSRTLPFSMFRNFRQRKNFIYPVLILKIEHCIHILSFIHQLLKIIISITHFLLSSSTIYGKVYMSANPTSIFFHYWLIYRLFFIIHKKVYMSATPAFPFRSILWSILFFFIFLFFPQNKKGNIYFPKKKLSILWSKRAKFGDGRLLHFFIII